jgi:hypothetical protein
MSIRPHTKEVAVLVLALCSAGCGASESARTYPFTLVAESDPGEPLPAVRLLRGKQKVAESDGDGSMDFTLSGAEGERVSLQADCPPNTTAYEPNLTTTLRTYANKRAAEILVRCAPNERELAVVVLLQNGANLPIQHRLRTLAVTDADGTAHFALKGKPGETFEIVINTENQPDLRPASPATTFTLNDRTDAELLERKFATVAKKKARVSRAGPQLPRKI